jgi:serine/threonine protein kinase
MPDLIADARAVFCQAVGYESPEQRCAYLDQACAQNTELRTRVEDLLRAYQQAGNFLGGIPPLNDTMADPPLVECPGTVVGPYKLLQQIGEGGFGVVFLAEQQRPVYRRVAFKVIKPGMDTREVIGRFEAERQALALMDHPNIAKVYEAGSTQTGRPYFVMELVQGVPITEYCDKCNLSTQERLELFVLVCQAVQHAHQKGVIHRDIKPNNVLVAIQDGHPSPKIIDFGVAKAINHRLTEHTLLTGFAQMVGTPLYMSPEQAELSPLGVDTRSDIYSLGALLYELLTSVTPFDKERLRTTAYDELRRIIREEEPLRPSTRISTLPAPVAVTVSERRRTDVRRLKHVVRGELDWIVMQCLEKDRNRRYDSAGSLARDVQRYLDDEAVQACPPSKVYRVRKYARRNKPALAFIALLVSGLGFLAYSNIAIKRERDAKTAALAQLTTETANSRAVSGLLLELLGSSNPDRVKGSEYTVRELLDDFAAGMGDKFAGQPEVEATVRSMIGNCYWRLGATINAEGHLRRAVDLHRRIFGDSDERFADSLVDYAWCMSEQNRFAEAEAHAREAIAIYRKRNPVSRSMVRAAWSRSRFLLSLRRIAEAEQVAADALNLVSEGKGVDCPEKANILHTLADAKLMTGQFAEAEKLARQSVEAHRRLQGASHPETAWGLLSLGRALREQQKLHEAEQPLREALDIFRKYYKTEHGSIRYANEQLVLLLEANGDRAALEALARDNAEHDLDSNGPGYHARMARLLLDPDFPGDTKNNVAQLLIRQAIDEYTQIAAKSSEAPETRLEAAAGLAKLIATCAASPGFDAELDRLNRHMEDALKAIESDPSASSACQLQAVLLRRDWGKSLLYNQAYLPLTERLFGRSIEMLTALSQQDPTQPFVWYCLADSCAIQGDIQWRMGRRKDAEMASARAMEIYRMHEAEIMTQMSPESADGMATDLLRRAYFLTSTQREEEAAAFVRKVANYADHSTDKASSIYEHCMLALMQLRLADYAGYRRTCKAILDLPMTNAEEELKWRAVWALSIAPDSIDDLGELVTRTEEMLGSASSKHRPFGLVMLGAALYRAGEFERAIRCLEEVGTEPAGGPPKSFYEVPRNYRRLLLAMATWKSGERERARGMFADTQTAVEQELPSPSASWNRRATLEVLCQEARALIRPERTPVEEGASGEVKP